MPVLGKNLIILDGAMGTLLLSEGFSGCLEDLNVTAAEEIKRIHRAYSSADIVLTNTFGLNSLNYKGCYSVKEIALKAILNARAARKTVFFDIGPIKNGSALTFKEQYKVYKEVAEAAKEADGFFAETFGDLNELGACVAAVKESSSKPVFATVNFSDDLTVSGKTPEEVALAVASFGADALGTNCSDAETTLKAVKRMVNFTLPVIAKPSLGLPKIKGGKAVYGMEPDEFARYAEKFIAAGASVIGGCCGTTPEFIRKLAKYSGLPVQKHCG